MLKDVIRAIDRGEVSRREELAVRIGVEASIIDGILEFLVKKEYLKVIDGMQQAVDKCNCGHCSKQCFSTAANKIYIITEKGKRLANGAGQR